MEMKTPEQWSEEMDILILDPDGWRKEDDPSWETPLTMDEFNARMSISTVAPRSFWKK